MPAALSGNLLAGVVSLAREGNGFRGDLACSDDGLPLASSSLSLVYALFVFETSPTPAALLGEISRVLKPEGIALFLTLNPWAPARLRWAFRGLTAFDPGDFAVQVRDSGLEVQRSRCVGPLWSPPEAFDVAEQGESDPASARFRMANLIVARRRDPGVTPLRAANPAINFRPGMSAG
jgi:SAM-dependent methyltransferase